MVALIGMVVVIVAMAVSILKQPSARDIHQQSGKCQGDCLIVVNRVEGQ